MYYLVRLEWEVEEPSPQASVFTQAMAEFHEYARLVAGENLPSVLAELARAIGRRVDDLVAQGAIEGEVIRYWLEVQPWNSFDSWQSARQGKPKQTPLTNGRPSDNPSSGSY